MSDNSLKIHKINNKWLIAGIILLILGYTILSYTPHNSSYVKTVFAWNKLTLSPIVLFAGYLFLGLSIALPNKK